MSCRIQVRLCFSTVALLLVTACLSPEELSRRLVTAPNKQHRPASGDAWQEWIGKLSGGNDPFEPLAFEVGPPPATLRAIRFLPATYPLKFTSELQSSGRGRTNLILRVLPLSNTPTVPVPKRGTVVILHGYLSQKEAMIPWAFVLAESGYRVVLVDLRGHGASSGETFTCGKVETRDLVQILDQLISEGESDSEIGVLGYSLGAGLALHWAARDSRVQTVVAIAPYNQPDEAFIRLARAVKIPASERKLRAALERTAAKLEIRWTDWSGERAAAKLTRPILLIGGSGDLISPPGDWSALKRLAPAGSEALMIQGAGHESLVVALHELAEPVTRWFHEHLAPNVSQNLSAGDRLDMATSALRRERLRKKTE